MGAIVAVLVLPIFMTFGFIQLALEKLGVTDQFFYIGSYSLVATAIAYYFANSKDD